VVDGGSTDGTPALAVEAGATVLAEPRRGYGRACITGAAAASSGHELVAILDGDGSCDPSDLARMAAATESADLVLGVRDPARVERGALPWHARLGNGLVAAALELRCGRRPGDLPPFKVLRADLLESLQLDETGYAWTVQLVARALNRRDLRIKEVGVAFRHRRGGRSKVSGSLMASLQAGRQMLRAALAETKSRPVLALMVKAPRPGHAKTRLARSIGDEAAAGFWRACLSDSGRRVMRVADALGLQPVLMLAEDADREPLRDLLSPRWGLLVQSRAGLGNALVEVFWSARARRSEFALAVSADNPTLPGELIADAARSLERAQAVLGPCPDGGYYLVGLRLSGLTDDRLDRILESVFISQPLRGGEVGRAAVRALEANGLRTSLLQPWADVDEVEDLERLRESLALDPAQAPATWEWFERTWRRSFHSASIWGA
jgi:glycosyltransferase A (GT-A) superfamily protein (DUF2064 family)